MDVAAKAVADVIGHGMREKCYGLARAALESFAGVPAAQLAECGCYAETTYADGIDNTTLHKCSAHAQPAPDAGEPVCQVRFRIDGTKWLEVTREEYEHAELYLPAHWERRTLYLRPASAASEADARDAARWREIRDIFNHECKLHGAAEKFPDDMGFVRDLSEPAYGAAQGENRMSDEIERLRKEVADLREWHRRDSAERAARHRRGAQSEIQGQWPADRMRDP